ncbi:NAD(P)/FAD-dependent oxidoreductase [Geomonas sp. Red32]|uniref:NAD(P)/FAD-dependent oxidoreductase n=1 Tax=Geomonas sp. Red32 TaxID=2912856 RepID=UPI00202CCA44|nr:NAD(P)/FAD-dependent oxidoreductase [Geomonas sp. Red32]MCM0083320.1 NAD(P)/FAD-dependent oxidoreductase [Geomonas sp. Red32]
MNQAVKRVVIIGGGFAGLNAAKALGNKHGVQVTLLDSRNHHLFQPLLYQVALAGLNPGDIAAPIRSILAPFQNITVLLAEATGFDLAGKRVLVKELDPVPFDYLIVASGSNHVYFGHEEWEQSAPGLKSIEQAREIRRRTLLAYEQAEMTEDPVERQRLLTFVIVGGGPTGVELAGAIAEMSRFTLAKDFRRIDPRQSRVVLIEGGPRLLPAFSHDLSANATNQLEKLGVRVQTECVVTGLDRHGVVACGERIPAGTVIWAAGVKASPLGALLGVPLDRQGRVLIEEDLSVEGHDYLFVLGDLAHFTGRDGNPLPGLAPVALQQGKKAARNILRDLAGQPRKPYRYIDKGMLATIGKNKAVGQFRSIHFTGFIAWLAWLFVHIYYLTGFANRLQVVFHWGWSYMTFKRGARLILGQDWRMFLLRGGEKREEAPK